MTAESRQRYDRFHPVEAVVDAWSEPGIGRDLHAATRRDVATISPRLFTALNRLARHDPVANRAVASEHATKLIDVLLLNLYGGGGDNDDERWRKATEIVATLVKNGLI